MRRFCAPNCATPMAYNNTNIICVYSSTQRSEVDGRYAPQWNMLGGTVKTNALYRVTVSRNERSEYYRRRRNAPNILFTQKFGTNAHHHHSMSSSLSSCKCSSRLSYSVEWRSKRNMRDCFESIFSYLFFFFVFANRNCVCTAIIKRTKNKPQNNMRTLLKSFE